MTKGENHPLDLNQRPARSASVERFCYVLWIVALLSIAIGLVVPLTRFAILSQTLQGPSIFTIIFVAIGILATITGIELWQLKKWGVILFALTGLILVSAFLFSFVEAVLDSEVMKMFANGALALFFSIGLVHFARQLWRSFEAD